MLSHVSLGTNDAVRAAAFYDPVLATLGIRRLHERDGSLDYGTSNSGDTIPNSRGLPPPSPPAIRPLP